MPCRVGITTNIKKCRSYWEARVLGLSNWRVISSYSTKTAAEDALNVGKVQALR